MSIFSTYPAAPLQLDASGNLLVNVNAGGGSGGTSATVGASYPATATAAGAKDASGNLAALNLDASGYLEVNIKAGSGSGLSVTDEAAFTAGTSNFVPSGGVFNDSATALTSGQQGMDRSTANRAKHVSLRNAAGTEIGTLSNAVRIDPTGTTTQPVSGTFWQATQPVSAAALPLPSGAATAAKQPALGTAGSASTDVISVQGIASMTALKVDGSAVTQPVSGTFWQATQPVSGTVTANQGGAPWSNNVTQIAGSAISLGSKTSANSLPVVIASDQGAVPASQSGTWTVQPGNTANTTPWLVTLTPAASGGLSNTKLISAATTNATSVKASAGQLYNVQAFNTNASSARFLKMYNKASAPTVGTDTPVATWLIPANGSGFVIEFANGFAFTTGIAFAVTGVMTDADTTAIAASEVVVNLQYK